MTTQWKHLTIQRSIFPSTLTFIALKKNQNFFYLPSNFPCLFIYMQFITAFFSKFEMINFLDRW